MSGGPRGAEEERRQRRRAGAGGQVFWIQCTHWYVLHPVGPGEPWKHIKQGSHIVTFVTMKTNGQETKLESGGSVWGLFAGCRKLC